MNKKQVDNAVLQRYVSSRPNHVICVDISFLTKKQSYFIGIDLATRCVVGHFYKKSPIELNDVIYYLGVMLQDREFANNVCIVHSDRESLFSNDQYYEFLKNKKVWVSRGSSKGYDNQVVERLHRTIKEKLKKALINHDSFVIRKNVTFGKVKSALLSELLNEVIESYNNTPHKANFGLSPNSMDEAFMGFNSNGIWEASERCQEEICEQEEKPFNVFDEKCELPVIKNQAFEVQKDVAINDVLVKNDNSLESQAVLDLRKQVVMRYANNWEQFFLDWRRDQAIKDERLFKENLMLRTKLSEVQETLDYVADQTKINEIARHKRELAKQKRELAQKFPVRDVVSKEELFIILNTQKSKKFSSCRRRLALVLLYLTGLRVGNLLILTIKQIKNLFTEGKTIIPLIKNGADRHSILLSEEGQAMLNNYKESFKVLSKNKTINDLLFTTKKNLSKAISRASFDTELNAVLKTCSLKFGKHLRTHSFRATMITDLLLSTPIDEVKEFIGHNDIKSTLTYKRGRLSEDCIKKVLKNLDKTRKI